MPIRVVSCVIAFTLAAIPSALAQPRAILELFTSQGCSVSPKADELAGSLAQDPNVLLLTYPVDYWDYLGWKDTLATAGNTARWRAYGLSRGDRKVFTPQMVVNGIVSATGSDKNEIDAAMQRTVGHLTVPIDVRETSGRIDIQLGPAEKTSAAEVWLVAYAQRRTVAIGGGENAGRSITYSNVVRRMTRLGAISGKPTHFMVRRNEVVPADADRYLVLVQAGTGGMPGPILGVDQASN